MHTRTILYHDVITGGDWDASGFPGGGAAVYKMERPDFVAHLERLDALGRAPSLIGEGKESGGWRITFDDGGAGALTHIAPLLEARGWRGHFFMTTGRIGQPGFLDEPGLRELVARGHLVGSHSVTHPLQMASCSREQLRREWRESGEALADIFGERPRVASIPGGAFSRAVAECAAEAGIRVLFTSEPTTREWRVGPVTCLGRYTLWRGMSPEAAWGFAAGRGSGPARQWLAWEAKKGLKRALGPAYLYLRDRVLEPSPAEGAPALERAAER